MRIFKHMNMATEDICPICKKKEDKPVVLVKVYGTHIEGNIEAIQVHVDCINLIMIDIKDRRILYQSIEY